MSVGVIVLQYLAQCVLPLVLKEASSYAVKRATRRAFDQLLDAPARPPQPRGWPLSPARVLSSTPGRVRLSVAGLRGDEPRARALEALLVAQPGVMSAEASATTGNLLVCYAVGETTLGALQAALTPRPLQQRALHVVGAPARAGSPGPARPAERRKWA